MNLTYLNEDIKDLNLVVEEGETLSLDLACFTGFTGAKIVVICKNGAVFNGVFADFSNSSYNLKIDVYLEGDHSECNWHAASMSNGDNRKVIDSSVYHIAPSTKAIMSNYGICMDSSKLTFTGTSHIKNGSKKSETRQEAKIIVFDPECDGKCSPILKIDENDVNASHAATVGQVNQSHLFYLMSRGISLEKAKRLITLGYVKPIEAYFGDEGLRKRIDEAVEGGL